MSGPFTEEKEEVEMPETLEVVLCRDGNVIISRELGWDYDGRFLRLEGYTLSSRGDPLFDSPTSKNELDIDPRKIFAAYRAALQKDDIYSDGIYPSVDVRMAHFSVYNPDLQEEDE